MKVNKEKIIEVLEQEKRFYGVLLEIELKEISDEDITKFKELCNTYSRIDILISVIMEQEEYTLNYILTSLLIEALHRNDFRFKDVLLKVLKTIEL